MIHCYPVINGVKTRCWFYENWDETPATVFVKWQPIAIELEKIGDDIQKKLSDFAEQVESEKVAQFNENKVSERVARANKMKIQGEIKELESRFNDIQVQAVSLFCNVPIDALYNMSTSENEEDVNDNNIHAYIVRLWSLANTPLPTDTASSFYFQTETDADIKKMEYQFKCLSFIEKHTQKGRKLKTAISIAKVGTYKIQDIWLQSTFANKEFIDIANNIIEQMNQGDFSGLIYLVSMLTVEDGQNDATLLKIRNSSNEKSYLENYRNEFRKLYKKREEIFTQSKDSLTIGTLIRIKNFFLSSLKT